MIDERFQNCFFQWRTVTQLLERRERYPRIRSSFFEVMAIRHDQSYRVVLVGIAVNANVVDQGTRLQFGLDFPQ
jgi:hypothetical protein